MITIKQQTMLQRSEIGKRPSKKSHAQAMLNKTCVTPKGDKYSLVSFEKVGRTYIYVYEWLNCPEEIKEITSNRVQSKTSFSIGEIMNWIEELKSIK